MARARLDLGDRRALIAVAVQFFVNGAMTASFVARAPQIRDKLGISVDELGLLLTLAAAGGIGGSVVAGRVMSVWSTRRVLQVGGVLMASSLLLIGGAGGFAVLLVALLIYMTADVLVDIAMNLQGSWISGRRHTPVMNRLHGLWSLGTLAGGAGAVAANAAGLSVFDHLLIVAIAMTVLLVFVARNALPKDTGHDEGSLAPIGPGRVWRSSVVLLVLAAAFAVVAELTAGDWAAFRLTDDFASSGAMGSLAFVAYSAGMTGMRFGGDWIQSRLGAMGLHRLSIVICGSGVILASVVPAASVAIAGFFLVGLGAATFMPKLYDDGARTPGRVGAALGAMTAGMRVAYLATPLAVGTLAGTSLAVGTAIAIVTVPALVGLAIVSEMSHRISNLR